ncbi:MAG TPA: TauD/TfdA family dioxygenase [Burkholderiales bacterium]|nr:TauD/TfdA family dioxygenase [Burkholderiales bacterium]
MNQTADIASAGRIGVRRIDGSIGVELVGVDLSRELDDDTFREVARVYDTHPVVVARDQNLTPAQHVAFSRRFGELEIHVLKDFLLPGHPELLVLSNILDEHGKRIGLADAGRVCVWHTDMSYLEKPPRGSMLYAREVPVRDGRALGDTLFADTAAAYEALPADVKKKLTGLKAIHRMTKGYEGGGKNARDRVAYSEEQRRSNPERAHPIVRTHPATGRKCLYVSRLCCVGIEGMPDEESEPLLEMLYEHCTRPEFVYRHRWQKGDLVMWDNCAAQHLATMDYELPLRRLMHRTTLMGTAPY